MVLTIRGLTRDWPIGRFLRPFQFDEPANSDMNLAMRALKGQSKPRMSLIRIFNASTWPHEWTRNKFITLILINDPIWTRICSHSLAATGYLNWAKNISSRKVVHRLSPFCTSKIVFIHHSSEFEVHMEAQSENEGGISYRNDIQLGFSFKSTLMSKIWN